MLSKFPWDSKPQGGDDSTSQHTQGQAGRFLQTCSPVWEICNYYTPGDSGSCQKVQLPPFHIRVHRAVFKDPCQGCSPAQFYFTPLWSGFQSSKPTSAHSRVRDCMCHTSPTSSFSEEHLFVRKLEVEMLREDPLPLTLSGPFHPGDSLYSQPPKPAGRALDLVLLLQFVFFPPDMFMFIVGRVMKRPNSASSKQGPTPFTWPSLFTNGKSACDQFSRPQGGPELCIFIYTLLDLHFSYWQKVSALLLETSPQRPPKAWRQVKPL